MTKSELELKIAKLEFQVDSYERALSALHEDYTRIIIEKGVALREVKMLRVVLN